MQTMRQGKSKPLFQNKYRDSTFRRAFWNYANPGYYFVTICVKNRAAVFGIMKNQKIQLSSLGINAQKCWQEIPKHFPFVKLDAFIIMPDHIHGIILITPRRPLTAPLNRVKKQYGYVGAQNFVHLRHNNHCINQMGANTFGPQSNNLGSIIRGFKIGVTKFTSINNIDFVWQRLYYDRIIRNTQELWRIRKYIRNNPKKHSCKN